MRELRRLIVLDMIEVPITFTSGAGSSGSAASKNCTRAGVRADKRKAVVDILEYAEAFNAELQDIAGFRPFGSLKGFKGRAVSLDNWRVSWAVDLIFGN